MKQTQALIPRALHTYRQVKHKGRLIVKSPVSDVCAILIYYCPRKMKDGFTHHKHKNGQPHAPVHGKCKSLYLLAVFFFYITNITCEATSVKLALANSLQKSIQSVHEVFQAYRMELLKLI